LFNLDVDPAEKLNVAEKHAEIIKEITKDIERHKSRLKPAASQLEI
jgi:hypothetical protein